MPEEPSAEAKEEAFDSEAILLVRNLVESARSDPNPTQDKYLIKIQENISKIQDLAAARNGSDHDIWMSYQTTLLYDHIAGVIPEFDSTYQENLKFLNYIVNYIEDEQLSIFWMKKIRHTFA